MIHKLHLQIYNRRSKPSASSRTGRGGEPRREDEMRRWKDWNAYMDLPEGARPGSINKNRQYYFIKIFCDNYCLIKALYESPKFIGMVSPNLEQLMWDN